MRSNNEEADCENSIIAQLDGTGIGQALPIPICFRKENNRACIKERIFVTEETEVRQRDFWKRSLEHASVGETVCQATQFPLAKRTLDPETGQPCGFLEDR
jgi:hypothetical protein